MAKDHSVKSNKASPAAKKKTGIAKSDKPSAEPAKNGGIVDSGKSSEKSSKKVAVVKGKKGFQPGVSGNPTGRPPGSRNKLAKLARSLIEEDAEDIVRKLIELAKDGNLGAAKVLLDRIIPPLRESETISLELPAIEKADDLFRAFKAVSKALADGQITESTLERVTTFLGHWGRAFETVEQASMIQEIRERLDEIADAPEGPKPWQ